MILISLNEFIVEDATLEWFGELSYVTGRGQPLNVTYKFDLRGG
jgi:hypothetical protein